MSDGQYFRQGRSTALNIAASAVIRTVSPDEARGNARLVRVQVLVAGTAGGAAYDTNAVANVAATNQVGAWPNTVGSYLIDMPVLTGITIVPGAGQTVAVSYE